MPTIAGAALLCNSGPRKAMPTHEWFAAQRSLWHSARVVWWMLKRPVHDAGLVRDMFFSADLPDTDFQRCNPAVSVTASGGPRRDPTPRPHLGMSAVKTSPDAPATSNDA